MKTAMILFGSTCATLTGAAIGAAAGVPKVAFVFLAVAATQAGTAFFAVAAAVRD